jgi:CBS domain-containing protein
VTDVAPGLSVRDVMSSEVVTAPATATVEELARTMLEHRIGSVVIVDADDACRPIGIVTETDFDVTDDPFPFSAFRWPRLFGRFVWSEGSLEELYDTVRRRPAAEVMSRDLVVAAPDTELWQAVELMLRHHVKRLPIVEDGRLRGILTRTDLLRCLLPDPTGSVF